MERLEILTQLHSDLAEMEAAEIPGAAEDRRKVWSEIQITLALSPAARNYRDRSLRLLNAAEAEHEDAALRLALYAQSERIGMKALTLQLERMPATV